MHQVLLWICILVQILLNEMSLIRTMYQTEIVTLIQLVYNVFYHSSLATFLIFGFLTTFSDPTDPLSTVGLQIENNQNTVKCGICKCSVKLSSKHCAVCNRCTLNFDHHCVWLNNCIGSKNYKVFFVSILSFMVNSLLVLTFCLFNLVEYLSNNKSITLKVDNKVDDVQGDDAWVSETSILLAYGIVASGFSVSLVALHVWLRAKGMTTFEYLVNKKKSECKKVSAAGEMFNKENETPNLTQYQFEHSSSFAVVPVEG